MITESLGGGVGDGKGGNPEASLPSLPRKLLRKPLSPLLVAGSQGHSCQPRTGSRSQNYWLTSFSEPGDPTAANVNAICALRADSFSHSDSYQCIPAEWHNIWNLSCKGVWQVWLLDLLEQKKVRASVERASRPPKMLCPDSYMGSCEKWPRKR